MQAICLRNTMAEEVSSSKNFIECPNPRRNILEKTFESIAKNVVKKGIAKKDLMMRNFRLMKVSWEVNLEKILMRKGN